MLASLADAQPRERRKSPESSKRDLNGLIDGGAYMSEARSWSNTPRVCGKLYAGCSSSLGYSGRREATIYRGELMSGGLISYQGLINNPYN